VCRKTISSPLRRPRTTLISAVNLLIESLDAAHKDGCCCWCCRRAGHDEDGDRQQEVVLRREKERETDIFGGKNNNNNKKGAYTVLTRARHSRSLGPLVKLATARRRTHTCIYIGTDSDTNNIIHNTLYIFYVMSVTPTLASGARGEKN